MILIFDDEPWFVAPYAEALEFDGFAVKLLRTEEEFMSAVAGCPDLEAAILDVMFPGDWEAGLGTARRLRLRSPALPIVFLTNRDDTQSLNSKDDRTWALCKRDVTPVDLVALLKQITSGPRA